MHQVYLIQIHIYLYLAIKYNLNKVIFSVISIVENVLKNVGIIISKIDFSHVIVKYIAHAAPHGRKRSITHFGRA